MRNQLKVLMFYLFLSIFFLVLWLGFWGTKGLLFFWIAVFVVYLFFRLFADRILLKLQNAQQVKKEEFLGAQETVEKLARRAGIPMPKLYLVADDSPNAMALGRNPYSASILLTRGLLSVLNSAEIEGVISYVIAQIRLRDTRIATLAGLSSLIFMSFAGMENWRLFSASDRSGALLKKFQQDIGAVAFIRLMIFTPIAALCLRSYFSREHVHTVDRAAAELSGDPVSLASALRKIGRESAMLPMVCATPALAHLFVVCPFTAIDFTGLFKSHPPVDERISKLMITE